MMMMMMMMMMFSQAYNTFIFVSLKHLVTSCTDGGIILQLVPVVMSLLQVPFPKSIQAMLAYNPEIKGKTESLRKKVADNYINIFMFAKLCVHACLCIGERK
jgi:hypothetical protein